MPDLSELKQNVQKLLRLLEDAEDNGGPMLHLAICDEWRKIARRWSPFNLSKEQQEKVDEWMVRREKYSGAIGGQFTYQFTETSLGLISKVVDNLTSEELHLTDYSSF